MEIRPLPSTAQGHSPPIPVMPCGGIFTDDRIQICDSSAKQNEETRANARSSTYFTVCFLFKKERGVVTLVAPFESARQDTQRPPVAAKRSS